MKTRNLTLRSAVPACALAICACGMGLAGVPVTSAGMSLPWSGAAVAYADSSYILPQSATSIISTADLSGLSAWELSLARNEIYARHGYIFDMPEYANYFAGKSWYVPLYTADKFDENNTLSYTEQRNVAIIRDYENALAGIASAPTVTVDYILPQSSSRELVASDLEGLSAWELSLARNEIYARHGYIFDTPAYANYFAGKSWYKPTVPASSFNENAVLSYTEQRNIALILKFENMSVAPASSTTYSSDYILPYSSSVLLSNSDLAGMSAWELSLARNEIYARHGYAFQDATYANYFAGKSWYHATYPVGGFDERALSYIEQRNIALILKYENAGGGPSVVPTGNHQVGTSVSFLRWDTSDLTGYISPTATPGYVRTVFCTWETPSTFGFTTYGGTHINGCFTNEWDPNLGQYRVSLWSDDGSTVKMATSGPTAWVIENYDGSLSWL